MSALESNRRVGHVELVDGERVGNTLDLLHWGGLLGRSSHLGYVVFITMVINFHPQDLGHCFGPLQNGRTLWLTKWGNPNHLPSESPSMPSTQDAKPRHTQSFANVN